MATSECVNWLFGRGISIGCNLSWVVPAIWSGLAREEKIEKIKVELREEMDAPNIDTSTIRDFLRILKESTAPYWRSRFFTTNWDNLVQQEILRLYKKGVQPEWMADSLVFHMNGTVEELEDNSNRSPFLLEEDPVEQRYVTVEAGIAFSLLEIGRVFVVVGMSFECETDKFLLNALSRLEDHMPIGESTWIIINPDSNALEQASSSISRALPNARVIRKCEKFNKWLDSGMLELLDCGAITFQ